MQSAPKLPNVVFKSSLMVDPWPTILNRKETTAKVSLLGADPSLWDVP
jgi:hypothetical protein